MQARRALMAIGLYGGWISAGVLSAVVLTFLYALVIDPHGDGPVGEGLGFLLVFALLLNVGIVVGYIRASEIWRKRNAQP